jgi:signal transduction histidine kinase
LAGIAEMATGVLHNIGNALNSVNTSASVAEERLRQSKVINVARIANLLVENRSRLPEFLARDPRGTALLDYLPLLGQALIDEREAGLKEFASLHQQIEQVNQIVAAQQNHARVVGMTENVPAAELADYALRLCEKPLLLHHIIVVRDYVAVPAVRVQRQKALEILTKLLHNAIDAVVANGADEKEIHVRLLASPTGAVQIVFADNGVGIPPEDLTRIFSFGFTTKKEQRGFGLHTSALAAKEMNGSLQAMSEGSGKGATLTLELPAAPSKTTAVSFALSKL